MALYKDLKAEAELLGGQEEEEEDFKLLEPANKV